PFYPPLHDLHSFPTRRSSDLTLLERYQIQQPFILYAGRIRPHKNLPRLIEAFAVARNDLESHPVFKNVRLVIIGDEISRHPEVRDRKSTRLNSSHDQISYAVF